MEHLIDIKHTSALPPSFFVKATGSFYTPKLIANHIIYRLIIELRNKFSDGSTIRIVDHFAGDGRLVRWFIEEWNNLGMPKVRWKVFLWEINAKVLKEAKYELQKLKTSNICIDVECHFQDAFEHANSFQSFFDIVISNPPWELLKPDHRELNTLNTRAFNSYIYSLRKYDTFLTSTFPDSQPTGKFAGWGTNLSRVGLELCYQICNQQGHLGIVMPASFLADEQSKHLRQVFLSENSLVDIGYFPAEAKLFEKVDTDVISMVSKKIKTNKLSAILCKYDKYGDIVSKRALNIPNNFFQKCGYIIPVSFGDSATDLLVRFSKNMPSWNDLEGKQKNNLWSGRELDETRIGNWLKYPSTSGPLFIKGRMINRYSIVEPPIHKVKKKNWVVPSSVQFERIVWRDVSRSNQKRRIIATIIPEGYVAGNSLGVAYFTDGNQKSLTGLLGIMSSLVFEFQIRFHLATTHVSLSSLRKVFLPDRKSIDCIPKLTNCVDKALKGSLRAQCQIEAIVAHKVYGLNRDEFSSLMNLFPKVTSLEKNDILKEFDLLRTTKCMAV